MQLWKLVRHLLVNSGRTLLFLQQERFWTNGRRFRSSSSTHLWLALKIKNIGRATLTEADVSTAVSLHAPACVPWCSHALSELALSMVRYSLNSIIVYRNQFFFRVCVQLAWAESAGII